MYLFLYLISIALYLFYKWATATYDFFEKRGIPFIKPLPLLGSQFGLFFKKQPFVNNITENYYKYKKHKVYGIFGFRQPSLFIADPKLVKLITVKDFDHFMDHRIIITEDWDPVFCNTLINLTGQKWKDMRSTLSPAFTGSKIRQMFELVNDVGEQTLKNMKLEVESGGNGEFEFKALAMKFAVDIIASCAFGLEVDSFKHSDNEFYTIAMKITGQRLAFKDILKSLGFMAAPKIMKFLGFTLMDKIDLEYLQKTIHETIKFRKEKKVARQDMIDILIKAKGGQLKHDNTEEKKDGFATVEESHIGRSEVKRSWNDDELFAQALIFFFGGFETVSTAMSFMAYELVCNPEVQQKLFEEIKSMSDSLDGQKITYGKIQSLKYLDQTVSETLRKWPFTALMIERNCVQDYELNLDGKIIKLDKSVNVNFPVWAFHRDPEYFSDPEKFDPERFSLENRHKIDPDTYLPFGIGPRNCIGSRFALMELKTIFYHMVLNFSFEATEKTLIPFEFEDAPLSLRPKGGIWLRLKPRGD